MGMWAELRVWKTNKPTKGTTLRLSGGRPGGTETFAPRRNGAGIGDGPEENSISRAEKRLERAQEQIMGEGDGVGEKGAGGREEGCIGAEDISEGAAIPEWEAPGLMEGSGDRDFIPGLDVQSP